MFEQDNRLSQARANGAFRKSLNLYWVSNITIVWCVACFVTWLLAMLVLFFLFAYRPDGMTTSLPIEFDKAGSVEVGNSSVATYTMSNRYSSLSFREYLGRTVGAIPPACAITQDTLPQPTGDGSPGSAGLLVLLGVADHDVATDNPACFWRNDPASILAAVSLDVGPVQKFTLLLLIAALFMLLHHRWFRAVEAEAWPGRDAHSGRFKPGYRNSGEVRQIDGVDEPIWTSKPELAQHPVKFITKSFTAPTAQTKLDEEPFFPVEDLVLDPLTNRAGETWGYVQGLTRVRGALVDKTNDESLVGPVDLITDVLKAGAHSGRVGDAERRMRVAAYEYNTSLSDRLEMAYYLFWLMPTVGFLGTIYGISASLVQAKGLFSGDGDVQSNTFSENIQKVVDGLGVAFDTTSMALICSAWLYWRLVGAEKGIRILTAKARDSLSNLLVDRMVDRVPAEPSGSIVPPPNPIAPPQTARGGQLDLRRDVG